jgi:geranylgeranyl reductase
LIYDVAIIGAGPSGASTAFALEKSGFSIVLLDKARFPREKPCAGVLPPRIFSETDIPQDIIERSLNGYRIFSPSGVEVESTFPKTGVIVRRDDFDNFLVTRLDTDIHHIHATRCIIKKDYVEVRDKKGSAINAKVVVGADGVKSVVHDIIGMDMDDNARSLKNALALQYEITIPQQKIDDSIGDWFEVHYTIPYGYGWLSPLKDSVKVGVGSISPSFKKNTKQSLHDFMAQDKVKENVSDGKILRKEAHLIPMGGPHLTLAAERSLVVGDAGGFVYPGTGEGVFYAIKSGRIAAETIIRVFEEERFDGKFLVELYNQKLKKSGLLSLREVDFIEDVLSSPEKVEAYIRKLKKFAST